MSGSNFAATAQFDGVVTEVDPRLEIIEVTPNPVTIPTVGDIDLSKWAKTIDSSAAENKYYRMYIPADDKYKTNAIYRLTKNTVGMLTDLNKSPKEENVPDEIVKLYKSHPVYLATFVLSPRIVTPKPTVFGYGTKYTRSQGTYLKQDLVVNVKLKQKVKKGDVLVYNAGFFTPKTDPFGPGTDVGVDWKHGVMANIVLIENSSTYEDACAIWREFGDKLSMTPAHVRQVPIPSDTVIKHCAKVGDEVYSTDAIMVVESGDLEILGGGVDPASVEFNESLAQQQITAKYHGVVREVNFLYGCSISNLHPSIKKLVVAQEKLALEHAKRMGKIGAELDACSGYIKPGTKYQGIEFTDTTVVAEFTIDEDLSVGEGDKLCIMTSNKTIVSKVFEVPPKTKSGRVIDLIFSVTSPYKRIVNTPFTNGIGNLVFEKAEQNIIDLYES